MNISIKLSYLLETLKHPFKIVSKIKDMQIMANSNVCIK